MDVVSVRIDRETKRRMGRYRDVNWAEVIRHAVRERLALEDRLREPVDRRRALEAARRIDAFRRRLTPGGYDSTREIRKWRDLRRRS